MAMSCSDKNHTKNFHPQNENYIHRFLSWFICMVRMTIESSSELRMRKGVISHTMKLPRNSTLHGFYTLLNHKMLFHYEYIVPLSQENALSRAWTHLQYYLYRWMLYKVWNSQEFKISHKWYSFIINRSQLNILLKIDTYE